MKILVTSRIGIGNITAFEEIKVTYSIISITDPGSMDAFFFKDSDKFVDCLRLKFDDIEEDEIFHGKKLYAMSPGQAKRVVAFVNSIEKDTDLLFVHCEAGVSRSAGVAAAIDRVKNGDDSVYFTSGRYAPNMNCYRLVLEEFGMSMTPMSLEELERANIEAIKKRYEN